MKFVAACKPFRWQLKEQSTIVWIGFLLVNQTWQGVGTKAFNWLSQLDRMIGELRGKSTHIGISAKNIPRNRLELHATACDWTAPCDICHTLPDLVVLIHNQRAQRCSMVIACLQIYRHLNSTVAAVRYPHKYSRWHNKHCSIRWRVQLPLLREDWEWVESGESGPLFLKNILEYLRKGPYFFEQQHCSPKPMTVILVDKDWYIIRKQKQTNRRWGCQTGI